jgi:hypothetical protein
LLFILFFLCRSHLGTSATTCGAISFTCWPSIHLSAQKRVSSLFLEDCILCETKPEAGSELLEARASEQQSGYLLHSALLDKFCMPTICLIYFLTDRKLILINLVILQGMCCMENVHISLPHFLKPSLNNFVNSFSSAPCVPW